MKNLRDDSVRTERRDAAENRQRILDAAQRLFEQNGVDQVSMNRIAIEAQIGAGTLYRRYSNKSELCLDLIKGTVAQFFEDIEKYLREHKADTPYDRLKEVVRLFMFFRDKKSQLMTGIESGAFDNKSSSLTQAPLYKKMHEIVVKLLSEITESEQNEPNNVFRADMLLYALFKSDSYTFQRDVRGYSNEALLEQLSMTFFPKR